MARSPFSTETQRRLNEDDRRWRFKLGLRAVATFLAIPAMILFAASTSLSRQDYGGNDWVDAMPLAPVLLALLYDPIHILLTTHPRLHRPIHPAWPLTIDLLIWGLSLPALVFSVGDGWFWYWQPVEFSIDGDFVLCDFEPNFWSEPCNPMIYTIGKMEIAANVFLALILIAHFILFVYSCIATHRYRKARSRSARERRNIELQYHRSPESHRASAPPAPPAYTPSTQQTSSHHPSNSISKSIVSSEDHSEPRGQTYKAMEAGHSPPLSSLHGGSWTRGVGEHAPQLSSPVSPVNSGSGGGFMDEEMGRAGTFVGVAGEGPLGDHTGVKYA